MNFLKSMTIERMYVTLLLCQFNRVVLSVWLLRPLGWDPTHKAPSTWDRADGAQCWIWRGVRLQLGTGPIWGEEERYGSTHPRRRPSRTSLVISGPRSYLFEIACQPILRQLKVLISQVEEEYVGNHADDKVRDPRSVAAFGDNTQARFEAWIIFHIAPLV